MLSLQVKFYHDVSANLAEKWLTPDTQLAKFERQGPVVLADVHSTRFSQKHQTLNRSQIPSFQSLTEKADRIEASLEKRLSDKDILTGMEEEGEVDPEEVAQQDTWLEISYMLICVL